MDTRTNVLSLYSGGGGLDLGFRMAVPDARTVCYVEREVSAIALLVDHMQTGQLDDAPVWTDSGTFDGRPWRGVVDYIIGGFPCQPFSVAGARAGTDDERWLWPHIERLVREIRPGGVFLENVPGLFHGGIEHVLGGLAALGYDAEWLSVRASDVGAPHRRERVFILAYSRCKSFGLQRGGLQTEHQRGGGTVADTCTVSGQVPQAGKPDRTGGVAAARTGRELGDTESVNARNRESRAGRSEQASGRNGELGDTENERRTRPNGEPRATRPVAGTSRPLEWPPGPSDTDAWAAVLRERPDLAPAVDDSKGRRSQQHTPNVGQAAGNGDITWNSGEYDDREAAPESEVRDLADGTPRGLARTDRLRILGNGVVPQQAALAFEVLSERMPR